MISENAGEDNMRPEGYEKTPHTAFMACNYFVSWWQLIKFSLANFMECRTEIKPRINRRASKSGNLHQVFMLLFRKIKRRILEFAWIFGALWWIECSPVIYSCTLHRWIRYRNLHSVPIDFCLFRGLRSGFRLEKLCDFPCDRIRIMTVVPPFSAYFVQTLVNFERINSTTRSYYDINSETYLRKIRINKYVFYNSSFHFKINFFNTPIDLRIWIFNKSMIYSKQNFTRHFERVYSQN